MSKNLVIVESPAKAKTIENFLGSDFVVKSCFGHVRDLVKKGLGVEIEKDFSPNYEISADKKDVIKELKKLSADAELVWLATDEDREGEAISWHLKNALDLPDEKIKRIVFHEITKPAILSAIEHPRDLDRNLINAQQARRVLDRIVGFKLSPILWKKIRPSLSAGRVQSVAVRLIVEREREINAFESSSYFRLSADLAKEDGAKLKADLSKRFDSQEQARAFLEKCKTAAFSVSNIETKPSKKSPASPFTTSTLQQEASRKLRFSVSQTMTLAQRLYESGKITYMRTDSVTLSDLAIKAAEEKIIGTYGKEYANPKQYQSKSKGAQEAHEAIRPTDMNVSEIEDGDYAQQRLYELIWKRTIASQMSNAELEKTTAKINVSTAEEEFVAKGEVIKFEGFLKVYLESTDEEEDDNQSGLLPPLEKGEVLQALEVVANQRFTHHPPRYTEASLVKRLEELGIGRPSTYAPTISTIQKRGYVVKEDREGKERKYWVLLLKGDAINEEEKTETTGAEKSKLYPNDIGLVVNDFLMANFNNVLDYNFTASVEKEFDEIAQGQVKWKEMIKNFYGPFNDLVEHTLENSERASGERELGVDPKSGKKVIARIGRFGPIAQIGDSEDEEGPKYASLLKNQSIESISLEEALDLFKLPRTLGTYEDQEVTAAIGRFGPYVRHGNSFVSLKKDEGDDPFTVELDRAIELIEQKRKADREKIIKTFPENENLQVLNGRWGPYINEDKKNYKIPKDVDPKSLTYEDCQKIIEEAKKNPKRRRGKK